MLQYGHKKARDVPWYGNLMYAQGWARGYLCALCVDSFKNAGGIISVCNGIFAQRTNLKCKKRLNDLEEVSFRILIIK